MATHVRCSRSPAWFTRDNVINENFRVSNYLTTKPSIVTAKESCRLTELYVNFKSKIVRECENLYERGIGKGFFLTSVHREKL